MDKKIDKVIIDLVDTKEHVKNLVTKDEFNEKFDQVITAVDNLAKRYDNHDVEHVSNQAAHDRMQNNIETHDGRIGKLELKTA